MYMDKAGYGSTVKIVTTELLLQVAKYLKARGSQPGVHVPLGIHLPIRRDTFAYPKEYICLSEGIHLRLATEVKYIFTYLLFPNIYTFIHVLVNIILKIRYMPIVKYICA